MPMFSTECKYKLKLIGRIARKLVTHALEFLFTLAALAALCLTAYEFGYARTDAKTEYPVQGYNLLLHLFFFGSLLHTVLNPPHIRQAKGFWMKAAVWILLLFIIATQSPKHSEASKWLQTADHILSRILLLFISTVQLSRIIVSKLQRHIRPEMMFAFSFLALIFTGTALLLLPKAHYGTLSFIDALFTSTSAVCITGLVTADISTTFTLTGQTILLLLIQIGGIGVMTFTSFIALSFFAHTSFIGQMALKNILSEETMSNIFRTLLYTFFTTLSVETVGSWILWWEIRDLPETVIPDPVFFAVFHAVSAFCNAGFSTLPDNLYNPAVRHLYGFQCWISVLIVIGGIGFPIVFNYGKLISHKIRNLFYALTGSAKRMPSHIRIVSTTTRIAITATLCLLSSSVLLFLLFENRNLQDLPLHGRLAVSLLGAATARTAGFNNLAADSLTAPTVFLTMFLMWIGASPLSTGGGIKTTTFSVAVKSIFSTLRHKEKVGIFKRRIPDSNVKRAYAIILLSVLWISLATLLIVTLVPGSRITPALFEVISASSTVGLSLNFTSQLNLAGKIIIILTMFVGRVGLITLLSGLVRRQTSPSYTYAEDNVILN